MRAHRSLAAAAVLAYSIASLVEASPRRAAPDRLSAAEQALASLCSRRPPPRPGEWLASHPEDGQTFEEFALQSEYRNFERPFLYVQPVGRLSRAEDRVLRDVAEALTIFYGKPVRHLQPLATDSFVWRDNPYTHQPQLSTQSVLRRLGYELPKDAQAVLAFTSADLWPGNDWNFVFGQASFDAPVGVWSLHRFGDPDRDYQRVLERALKLALHETGHMFGLRHCTAYQCGMSGTNNLAETDRSPMAFCPVCEHKLWWALRLDPAPRYDALAKFAREHALPSQAALWQRAAQRVRSRN